MELNHFENLDAYIERCEELNQAVANLSYLDSDHQIGQAYFMKIADFCPKAEESAAQDDQTSIGPYELEKLWVYHIEPLLEEYLGAMSEDDGTKASLKTLKDNFVTKLDASNE